MMKFYLLVILLFLLTGCEQPDELVVETEAASFTILALGDSLTEGLGVSEAGTYPSILGVQLANQGYQNIRVINAGLSGETSSGLKNRLNWVLSQKPDLTILNIGANDAMRGLPLTLTRSNIDEIIEKIIKADSAVILAGMQIYDNLGQDYVAGFKNIYPELAHKYQVRLIPFFLENVAGLAEFNQTDLLHPNAKGYQVIVDKNILPVVLDFLKNLN
ncbi:MAG: arylesterase [Proteobacteria bacterium]|nr:arylesterase [Pseudomonadota bacterium]